ncbi:6-phosphogluconolactonase-like [Saccostrea cucullata]|uniref:6-phosphogluconolactonase-like n=1 Tax=Saccostrea cuccullata TaxID=36930 RepID=UPI002ED45E02
MAAPKVSVLESETEVSIKLCDLVIDKANSAIQRDGKFTVGLSGGSLAKFLCNGLPGRQTDWSKWQVFFCDERHVPYTDPECTYTIYKSKLVDNGGPLPGENIFPINPDISVEDAAKEYKAKILGVFGGGDTPRFHLLLLGMGPDGHTCSLFPNHPLLQVTDEIIASISDSPKPPPSRVTMTFPLINNCECAIFASCGAGKADIVKKVLESDSGDPLPAARVRPTNGELIWLLDKAAASQLKTQSNI